jgi:DDE superfamily endonuclease
MKLGAAMGGRCPRGERLIGRVPFGTWETLKFVAGLRCDEMTAPLVIDGAMNGETFLAYIEQGLAPTLNRDDIVVMDNLRAHKVAGIKEAIEAVGADLRYLPGNGIFGEALAAAAAHQSLIQPSPRGCRYTHAPHIHPAPRSRMSLVGIGIGTLLVAMIGCIFAVESRSPRSHSHSWSLGSPSCAWWVHPWFLLGRRQPRQRINLLPSNPPALRH